jgi:aminoglycoside phosphotransferase (APT) family kinase protein
VGLEHPPTASGAGSSPLLAATVATQFVPGTNLRGGGVGGAWMLLLDRFELGDVACLGPPGERTLRTLARHARSVTVVGSGDAPLRRSRATAANVAVVGPAAVETLGPVDLAVVTSSAWARRAAADRSLAALLERSATVYAETGLHGRPERWLATPPGRRVDALWLGVAGGEVKLAAGRDDAVAITYLRRPASATSSAWVRWRPVSLARATRRHGRIASRQGLLIRGGPGRAGPGAPVPAYLRAIADAAGAPLDDCRVALAAPGEYPSRKAILFVFGQDETAPRYVVKLSRDPAFNERLDNEWRALRALAAAGVGDAATVPVAAFLGRHAGLAVLGQTPIAGAPFRLRTTARSDCPLAQAAIAWLLGLGASTADPTVAGAPQAAATLQSLLDRFARLYRPTAAEHALLAAQVEAVARSRQPFPVVFQHGDPGTWNLLITPDGRPAFLDWEAAEPRGMPLWDLFYFARSAAVGVARASGTRDPLDAVSEHLLADGPMIRALTDDVDRHCARIGLDRGLVGPLFFMCWLHRALKEAMRLSPDELAGGRYVRLLRLLLKRRDAPGLQRLFGGPVSGASSGGGTRPRSSR